MKGMCPEKEEKSGRDLGMGVSQLISRRRFVGLVLTAVGTLATACRSTFGATPATESTSMASGSSTQPPADTARPGSPSPPASLTAASESPALSAARSPTVGSTVAELPPTPEPIASATVPNTYTPVPNTSTPVPPTITSPPPATATAVLSLERAELMAHWPKVDQSRVVVVRHGGVWVDGVADSARVRQMLDEGMRALVRVSDVAAVWQALFERGEKVLLKVNCIAYGGPTQPEVTYAVAQRLQEAGLHAEDILIFDRTDHELQSAGYVLNEGSTGVQCHGARGEGSEAALTQARVRFFQEIDNCDAIVNLPTPKQHGGAGISVALKNHYGSVNQPGRLHDNWCDPAIAELNAQQNIHQKTRLVVGAALRVSPADWNRPKREDALLLSFDPVALDTVARDILVRHRQALGLDTGFLVDGSRQLASAQALGLGATDAGHIELQEVVLG